jgi:hypothetical protein
MIRNVGNQNSFMKKNIMSAEKLPPLSSLREFSTAGGTT